MTVSRFCKRVRLILTYLTIFTDNVKIIACNRENSPALENVMKNEGWLRYMKITY